MARITSPVQVREIPKQEGAHLLFIFLLFQTEFTPKNPGVPDVHSIVAEACVCAGYQPMLVRLREQKCTLQVQPLHIEQKNKCIGFSYNFILMDPVGREPGVKLTSPSKGYLKIGLFSGRYNLKISENQINLVPTYGFQKLTTGYWL